jgi:hypothetical protein
MSAAKPPQGANSVPAWDGPSSRAERLAWIIGAAGALLFAAAAYAGRAGAFQSYLFVWWFLLGIPLGSMAVLMVHNMTGGAWGELIRPTLEAAARLLPLSIVLVVPLLFGVHDLYAWSRPDARAADALLQAKAWYLSVDFFLLRNVVYFAVWLALGHLLRKWGFARIASATVAQFERLRAISAIGLLVYGATVTLAAVDWIMSLMPHWYSTTFGLLTGIGQALCAFSFAIVCTAWRLRGAMDAFHHDAYPAPRREAEKRAREEPIGDLFLDLGNLLLMFVMTWTYLAFTQYLVIWAEDLPNEIAWYLARVNTDWRAIALFLVAFHFALPFLVLLSRRAKRAPRALGALAALLLFAHLVDAYWLVVPAFRPDGVTLAWSDLPAIAALGGIWLAVFLRIARAPCLARHASIPAGRAADHE